MLGCLHPYRVHSKRAGYVVHHIKPASFFKGHRKNPKANESTNLVFLTDREHFIAHRLLAEIYGGKMSFAYAQMVTFKGFLTGKVYARHLRAGLDARSQDPDWIANNDAARVQREADPEFHSRRREGLTRAMAEPGFWENHAKAMARRNADPEWQQAHAEHIQRMHLALGFKERQREILQARNADTEFQQRCEESMKVVRATPEFKAKCSESRLKLYQNPEYRKNHREAVAESRKTETFKVNFAAGIARRADNQGWVESLKAMQQRKIKPVIGTNIETGETVYLAGKQKVLAAGFDNRGVSACIRNPSRNKSYRGYTWILATDDEIFLSGANGEHIDTSL